MGACRHGDRCDKRHNKPTESPTLLFANMYTAPPSFRPGPHGDIMVSEREMDDAFEEFYVDAFTEISKWGALEELNVCANPGAHLNGNVYVKFSSEEQAATALKELNGRTYDGKPLRGELCPVTDFGEARCWQYVSGICDRRMCNFLHLKEPNSRLAHQLFRWQLEEWKKNRTYERPPPALPPSKERGGGGRGGRFDDRRDYRRDNRRDDRGRPRWDDSNHRWSDEPYGRGRSPSPGRYRGGGGGGGRRDYGGDAFGRDVRGDASSEREIEERLAEVRNALADSRKRERPESGFDQDGPERATKAAKYEN